MCCALAVLALSLSTLASTPASERPQYAPSVLAQVRQKVEALAATGERALIVFDLDDTLLNTRERNLRLLHDFAKQASIKEKYPSEVKKLEGLGFGDISYLIKDTLRSRGIKNDEFIREMETFWAARFFTNPYCSKDAPIRGAVEYVNSLTQLGATVIYLTGRNWPGMGQGTVVNLTALGFPTDPSQAILLMKPQKEGDDLLYKKGMFAAIAKMGTVIAAFENEPANINEFQKEFSSATMVFVDTAHSPKPVVPNNGVQWIADFTL